MPKLSSRRSRSRSGLRGLVVAVVAAFAVTSAPAISHAAEQGNIVTFGDSYTANPDQIYNTLRDIAPGMVPADYPRAGGCLQGPNNWPRKLSAQAGAPVKDWSCTAQTSRTMLHRLEQAIGAGDLHAGTRSVVLAAGMNNYGPFGHRDGVNIFDHRDVRNNFMADISAAAERIRSVAPNTRIVLAGTPSITSGNALCLVNVIPNAPLGIPGQPVAQVESWNRGNQRDAAAANGVEFVDLKTATAGNATCAPDAQRFISGGIDTTTPNYVMNLHPNDAGNAFIAGQLAAVV